MKSKRLRRYSSLVLAMVILATLVVPIEPAMAAVNWSTKAPMPTARMALRAAVVNNKIYAIGGVYSNRVDGYDPATDTWVPRAPMPTTRWYFATGVVNDKIYAIGGQSGSGASGVTYYNAVEEYDPATNVWTTKTPMPTARGTVTAAVVNDKIYVIGGNDTPSACLSTVEEYDPATDTWTTKSSIPNARCSGSAQTVNGKIYVIGGFDGPTVTAVDEYDPVTDNWSTKTSVPAPAYGFDTGVINNKIYVVSGNTNKTAVNKYDPVANTWTAESSMPTERHELAVAAVDDKIYALGGWSISQQSMLNTNEEAIVVGVDQEPTQVQATVDPAIELTINPATLQFGNVNPSVGSYSLVRTATVRSNANWQLLVRKVTDLTGASTGWVVPSNQLTFTSPAQPAAVEFQTVDTLVGNGGKTAGTNLNVTYNLNVTWDDEPDSYNAEHIYTAVQP